MAIELIEEFIIDNKDFTLYDKTEKLKVQLNGSWQLLVKR
jgi:hypothetical protein